MRGIKVKKVYNLYVKVEELDQNVISDIVVIDQVLEELDKTVKPSYVGSILIVVHVPEIIKGDSVISIYWEVTILKEAVAEVYD